MPVKTCCHCHQPIACDRWEASISGRAVINGKPVIWHEHYACAVLADKARTRQAIEAVAEAERSGVA